jgi:hypothetical protein
MLTIAAVLGGSLYAYTQMRGQSNAPSAKAFLEVNEKYSPPFYQIHVDPAVWTNGRDDRAMFVDRRGSAALQAGSLFGQVAGAPWAVKTGKVMPDFVVSACGDVGMAKEVKSMDLREVYMESKNKLYEEARSHPGFLIAAGAM